MFKAYQLINLQIIKAWPLLIVIAVLLIRMTMGVDFADEGQYLGEMLSLVQNNKLFVTDLFYQQFCYVIFYPLLKLYFSVFQEDGFLLFTRSILASLSFLVFIVARKSFLKIGVPILASGILAVALTFSIAYHNIFSLSYNTISQVLWILFLLFYWNGAFLKNKFFPVIICLSLITHPLSGVAMSGLVFARCLTVMNFKYLISFSVNLIFGMLFLLVLSKEFFLIPDFLISIKFSKSFGVLTTLLENKDQIVMTAFIFIMNIIILVVQKEYLKRFFSINLLLLSIFICFVYLIRTAVFVYPQPMAGYWPKLSFTFGILLTVSAGYLFANIEERYRTNCKWLIFGILGHFLTLTISSGNGFAQSVGAFWVGLTILVGLLASITMEKPERFRLVYVRKIIPFALLGVFVLHWTLFPYRSVSWVQSTEYYNTTGLFRFIGMSPHQKSVLESYRNKFGQKLEGKRLLIAGQYPVLYFIYNAEPATCMLFMHSIPNKQVFSLLEDCIERKAPNAILQLASDSSEFNASEPYTGELIKSLQLSLNANKCSEGKLFFPTGEHWTTKEGYQQYKLCTQ